MDQEKMQSSATSGSRAPPKKVPRRRNRPLQQPATQVANTSVTSANSNRQARTRSSAGQKRIAEQTEESPESTKQPRLEPVAGDVIRALWSGDKQFHRATILTIDSKESYQVEYFTPNISPAGEKLTANLWRSQVQRMFKNLPARPKFTTTAEKVKFGNDMDVILISAKVLAKRVDDVGAGAWLPAIVLEKDCETLKIKVDFMKDHAEASVLRTEVELIYEDTAMKLDKLRRPFYPYDLLPPAGKKYNYEGQKGYRHKFRGNDLAGKPRFSTTATFNNITMMAQTTETADMNGTQAVSAQHLDYNGTFTVATSDPAILATWTNGCEDDRIMRLDNTRIVYWQYRGNGAVWLEFQMRDYQQYRFAMAPGLKEDVLNMACIMSPKLQAGRTEASHFTEAVEVEDLDESSEGEGVAGADEGSEDDGSGEESEVESEGGVEVSEDVAKDLEKTA